MSKIIKTIENINPRTGALVSFILMIIITIGLFFTVQTVDVTAVDLQDKPTETFIFIESHVEYDIYNTINGYIEDDLIIMSNGRSIPKYYCMELSEYDKFMNSSLYENTVLVIEEGIREEIETEQEMEKTKINELEEEVALIHESVKEIVSDKERDAQLERINYVSSIHDDIFTQSNLTITEVGHLLEGTRFEGNSSIASTIIQTEAKYNINALVILGVAKLEAGVSLDSAISLSKNNLFGIFNSNTMSYSTFDSVEDNIDYFGELMSGSLYKGSDMTTLFSIQPRYCPPNESWDDVVLDLIYTDYEALKKFIDNNKYIL